MAAVGRHHRVTETGQGQFHRGPFEAKCSPRLPSHSTLPCARRADGCAAVCRGVPMGLPWALTAATWLLAPARGTFIHQDGTRLRSRPRGQGGEKGTVLALEFILTLNFIPPGLRSSKRRHFSHRYFIDALPPRDPQGQAKGHVLGSEPRLLWLLDLSS